WAEEEKPVASGGAGDGDADGMVAAVDHRRAGAVLLITDQQQQAEEQAPTFPDTIRPAFVDAEIPVFHLPSLLTAAQLTQLQTRGHNQRAFAGHDAVFVQPASRAVAALLLALWKLRCYGGGGR
ncbi:hypothetical protein KEM52_005043, partial [Ascosphaera acerosa]